MPLPIKRFPKSLGLLDLFTLNRDEEIRFCRVTLSDRINQRRAMRTYAEEILAREWGSWKRKI